MASLFGGPETGGARLVYILVGIAALARRALILFGVIVAAIVAIGIWFVASFF